MGLSFFNNTNEFWHRPENTTDIACESRKISTDIVCESRKCLSGALK